MEWMQYAEIHSIYKKKKKKKNSANANTPHDTQGKYLPNFSTMMSSKCPFKHTNKSTTIYHNV